jgi:hypothetical protein
MFHEIHSTRSTMSLIALVTLLATSSPLWAQTGSQIQTGHSQFGSAQVGSTPFDGASIAEPPLHQVIRSPRIEYQGSHQGSPVHSSSTHVRSNTNPVHPLPHLIHQHTTRTSPAVIPSASQREVWKTPFSYGYFGANGSRHWIRHYGYRDRDKEWRLR